MYLKNIGEYMAKQLRKKNINSAFTTNSNLGLIVKNKQ